jgi:hypothetical protein
VSLSQEPVFSTLRNRFICGYKNIMQEGYAGDSGVHPIDGNAVNTTNGAGPHNLQTFIMTADGTVLHCLPGFWSSADLAAELEVAEKLSYIWEDTAITAGHKADLFKRIHLEHLASHTQELVARSHLQGFDAQHIYKNRKELSDCISDNEAISAVEDPHKLPYAAFKTTDKIMHERMAKRPFHNYSSFDTGTYTSYGCNHYDKGENEMEGGPPTLALKGKSLRSITRPTAVAAALKVNPSVPTEPSKLEHTTIPNQFVQLAKQGQWPEAFRCADKYIKTQFTQPGGYEMRSLAALQLGWYQQAYDDASRALWLGSKHSSATILRARAASKLKPLVYLNTKSL